LVLVKLSAVKNSQIIMGGLFKLTGCKAHDSGFWLVFTLSSRALRSGAASAPLFYRFISAH
jgi:hypothetical protein